MRIAVTSQNFRTVTGHAGKNRRFLVFEAEPTGEVREINRLDLPKELTFHVFNGSGSHPVDGSDVIITQSCRVCFMHRFEARGIRVIVTSETDPEKAARAVLVGDPLPPPDLRSHEQQCH